MQTEKKVLSETCSKLPPRQQIQNIPPVLSLQQPTILPINNTNVVTRQPILGNAAAITLVGEQNQGIATEQVTEEIGSGDKSKFSAVIINRYQEEEAIKEIRNVVSTPTGDYVHVLLVAERRVICEAIRQLYEDTQNEEIEESTSLTDDDTAVNPSSFERCCDIFCQACSLDFRNPFKRHGHDNDNTNFITKLDIMTPKLRRVRAKGMNLLKQLVFPFVGPGLRMVWILLLLFLVIFSAGVSIASYVNGSRDVFHLVHLVLASVSTALALIDACYSLPRSWKLFCKRRREKREEEEARHNLYQEYGESQPRTIDEESSCCCKCRWCKSTCCNCVEKFSDVARTLLAEVFWFLHYFAALSIL